MQSIFTIFLLIGFLWVNSWGPRPKAWKPRTTNWKVFIMRSVDATNKVIWKMNSVIRLLNCFSYQLELIILFTCFVYFNLNSILRSKTSENSVNCYYLFKIEMIIRNLKFVQLKTIKLKVKRKALKLLLCDVFYQCFVCNVYYRYIYIKLI